MTQREDRRGQVSEATFWENIYEGADDGKPPWDADAPAPAFVNLFAGRGPVDVAALLGEGGRRAIVPGCGLGHDLVMLGEHGFEPLGLDLAIQAAEGARALMAAAGIDGRVEQRDVFEMGADGERCDLLLEYTCYCAISPDRRGEYADAIRRVLRPGGVLVSLFFPFGEQWPDGGPPFRVVEQDVERDFRAGFEWRHFGAPEDFHPRRDGLERLLVAVREL